MRTNQNSQEQNRVKQDKAERTGTKHHKTKQSEAAESFYSFGCFASYLPAISERKPLKPSITSGGLIIVALL